MVREIIHVQVGQCGNQIGNIFWNTTGEEHHLDVSGTFEKDKEIKTTHKTKIVNEEKGDKAEEPKEEETETNPNPSPKQITPYDEVLLDKIGVYYECASDKLLRYTPRAVLVDLEPGTLDRIKANRIGGIFKPDNFVMGSSGCANNWAKGRFTEGLFILYLLYHPCTNYIIYKQD